MRNSPNRLVATVFGAVYLLVGLLGFAVTSGVGFVATEGANLIIFEVNPLHNVIHLAIGAALLFAGLRGTDTARTLNATVGAVYLLVGIVGLFLLDSALTERTFGLTPTPIDMALAAIPTANPITGVR